MSGRGKGGRGGRGGGRGGKSRAQRVLQKQNVKHTRKRVDDGDVMMDVGGGSTRVPITMRARKNRGGRIGGVATAAMRDVGMGGAPDSAASSRVVQVSNYPQSAKLADILSWLRQKVHFNVVKSDYTVKRTMITTESPDQAMAIFQLKGSMFRKRALHVKFIAQKEGKTLALTNAQKQVMVQFFDAVVNKEAKFANMAGMAAEAGFANANIKIDFQNIGFASSVFRLLNERYPETETIDLSRNGITTLRAFASLHKWVPKLRNISFCENQIREPKEFIYLKLGRWRELILTGNPIAALPNYRQRVKKIIKKLQLLDGEEISPPPPVVAAVEPSTVVLPPVSTTFFDSQETTGITTTFLTKFFAAFDSDRPSLANVYAQDSNASLSFAFVKGSATGPGKMHGIYSKLDRNHLTHRDPNKRFSVLKRGPVEITNFWKKFPKSVHRLEELGVDAYVLNSVAATPLLYIQCCGIFHEDDSDSRRAFSRTLMLQPAAEGSSAAVAGWPAVIVNDMLTIRSATTGAALVGTAPGTSPAAAPVMPAAAAPAGSPAANMNEQMVARLVQETGLSQELATQCLGELGWNYDAAIQRVQQMKSQGLL